MKKQFKFEVVTVLTHKTRSVLGAVVDQANHVISAASPEEARDIVLKASPHAAKLLICGIINLDVARGGAA